MRLPLFPLPLVLFPGATLPLHLFEPRYRELLAHCEAGDRRFGILTITRGEAEADIPAGRVGCIAEIGDVARLEDGRANIVVTGRERFAFTRYVVSDAGYRVGDVEPYADEPATTDLTGLADDVRALWARVADAARRIADESAPVPELPADPAAVAFAVAGMVDIELEVKQTLLASRDAAERLRVVRGVLARVAGDVLGRAEVHEGAKTNGKGRH